MEFSSHEVQAYVSSRVPGMKPTGRELRGPCPVHKGKNPSFAMDRETGFATCHSKCGRSWDLISLEESLTGKQFAAAKESVFELVGRPKVAWEDRDVIATFDYQDEAGNVVYQVIRKRADGDDKAFFQRRPAAGGKWTWGLGDVKPVPFQLPKVIPSKAICICYSDDTEILTSAGWVAFPELTEFHEVAQYAIDGQILFGRPMALQQFDFAGEMVYFKADFSDLLVTPDHRVLSRASGKTKKGADHSPTVQIASEIVDVRQRQLPVSGLYDAGDSNFTEDQARLIAAYCADGSYEPRGFKISWNLKKSRKKHRIRELLKALRVPFTEHVYESCKEWTQFKINKSDVAWMIEAALRKRINVDWIHRSLRFRQALLQELGHWDGDHVGVIGSRYFTANKCEADAVSAIAAISGWSCILRKDDRKNRPEQRTQYVLNLGKRAWRTVSAKPVRSPYSGQVYCCTVKTGFVVTRRNGKTIISGNCEGEKDALTLTRLGFVATCNNGGAGNFKPELAKWFTGKRVAVFFDNDDPGRAHALKVAAILKPVAESVRIVEIPGLAQKGDVTDYVRAGGTLEQLKERCKLAQEWTEEWQFTADVPDENERYIRTPSQLIAECGGLDGFWALQVNEGLSTPWRLLDDALAGGMRKGEVYVIGANQGAGKTSMALQFMIHTLRERKGVLMFSMEMRHRSVFHRMVSIEARVDLLEYWRLKKYAPQDPDLTEMSRRLGPATAEIDTFMLTVSTKASVTPEYLLNETARVRKGKQIDLVVIDHMQLMGATGSTRGDYEKFTAISRATKQTAMEMDLPVLLISQTSRNNSSEKRTELEVSDLRGSGAIEEDAAAVILLYHDKEDRDRAQQEGGRFTHGPILTHAKLGKNRYGWQGGYLDFWHRKNFTRFDLVEKAQS